MRASATGSGRPGGAPSGQRRVWAAAAVVLLLAASAFLPLVVVLLGLLLVALVGLDTVIPGLVPGLRDLLRVPVAPVSRRRARLLLAAGAGVVLVLCGTAGAKLRGQLRTEWKLRQSQRHSVAEQVAEHLQRAREHLDAGEVELAELTLMDVNRIPAADARARREVDELLERVRRSGDAEAILDILLRLPPDEFEAFASGASVPAVLEFPERVLTYRAVEIARAQLEQARTARAHPTDRSVPPVP